MSIVLASGSPRRRLLLGEAGVEFEVIVSDADESVAAGQAPEAVARSLAERKARAVARRLARDPASEPTWIIGADTVVALADGELLGKPDDAEHARRMLEKLSGSRHAVITGVCVVRLPGPTAAVEAETTWVRMRTITAAEIEAYVVSGEWRDKAGGYAIQESADRFVVQLEGGGFDNVVGLPVERTLALLRAGGAPI